MRYFHSWSGGKDSTASIILDHIHGLPPSTIVFCEVMFDNKRGISGELPEHIDFIMNKAKPLFEEWGYKVDVIRADKDFLSLFYRVLEKSKDSGKIGKYKGFMIAGKCDASRDLKNRVIEKYYKRVVNAGIEFQQYVGIATDEPERLARLKGTNKVSLLERYGYTEQMAFDLCEKYDLLSPIYRYSKRGGCWFCPNARWREQAHTKSAYPALWEELRTLSNCENLATPHFKNQMTFAEVDKRVDQEIAEIEAEAAQLTLFDFL